MAFIIQQSSRVINVIDTNMPDPSEQIVDAFSLDSVARPFPQTAPTNDILRIYGANGDFLREFILDGTLQTQDLNAAPVVWTGTLDELSNKINNEYFVNQSSGGTFPPDYANSALQEDIKESIALKQFNYFDLSAGGLTFPVTPISLITQINGVTETNPPSAAPYANIDELITDWNNVMSSVVLSKRSETSFYVKQGNVPLPKVSGDFIRIFKLPASTFFWRDVKLDTDLSGDNLSSSDQLLKVVTGLEESRYPRIKASVNLTNSDSGTVSFPIAGVTEFKYYTGQQGEQPITFPLGSVSITDAANFVALWRNGMTTVLGALNCEEDPTQGDSVIFKSNDAALPLINSAYIEVNSGATIRRYSLPNWVISMQGDVLLTTEESLLEENIKDNATRSDYYIHIGNTATALSFSDGSAIAEGTFGDIISITDDAGGAIYYSLNGVDPIADPNSFPRVNGNSGNQSFRGLKNIDLSKVRIIGETGGSRGYFNFTYNKNNK